MLISLRNQRSDIADAQVLQESICPLLVRRSNRAERADKAKEAQTYRPISIEVEAPALQQGAIALR